MDGRGRCAATLETKVVAAAEGWVGAAPASSAPMPSRAASISWPTAAPFCRVHEIGAC